MALCVLTLMLALPGDPARGADDAPNRGVPVFPVPPEVLRVCHRAQGSTSFRVLCPAGLPRASVGYPGQPPNRVTAGILDDKRRFYGVEFAYGAPYESRQWRNHPRRFLHLAIIRAGTSLADPPKGSTRLGERRIAGRKGRLFHAPPYSKGGGYHGNHLMFTWHEGKAAYTISLHSWRRAEALQLLEEVISGLRPPRTMPIPERRGPARVTSRIRIGSQPSALAVGGDSLWVARYVPAGKVVRLNLQRANPVGRAIRVGSYPYRGMAADDEAVWIVAQNDSVTRIDARTGQVIQKAIAVGETPFAIAIGARYVWVANYDDGTLTRVDPRTNEVAGDPIEVDGRPNGLAFLHGSIWVTDFDRGRLVRVDESLGKVVAEIPLGSGPSAIAVTWDGVWVSDFDRDEVIRVDPSTNEVVAEIAVGPAPSAVAASEDSVWVTDYWDGTVLRIDTETNEVGERMWIGGKPWQMVASQEDVWVLDQSGPITRIPLQPRDENGGKSWLGWLVAVAVAIAAFGSLLLITRHPKQGLSKVSTRG